MASSSNSPINLICCLVVLLILPFPSRSADPDLLQDFCVADLNASMSVNGFPCKPAAQVVSDDFFFDGLSKEGNTTNIFGSTVTPANVFTFPGLNTLGISMNRVDYAPGGLSPPHTHPRATESGVIIEGKLLVGFITADNVFHSKVLNAGEMFVIPRGLIHFQLNVGEGKALSLTAFNSHFPGAAVAPKNLFDSTPSIPNSVLSKAFQVVSNPSLPLDQFKLHFEDCMLLLRHHALNFTEMMDQLLFCINNNSDHNSRQYMHGY